ncbi:class I SAM-dependent methyltransferase [Propionivibrio sp.]|uniref:class I SAM-dependent methyltransferase n=1 Tax=Propionivibrio sp. TaxID=2212460 RepID=UPI0039E59268
MKSQFRSFVSLAAVYLGLLFPTFAFGVDPASSLESAISGKHRSDEHKALDRELHPKETLEFFGIKPDHKVIEIWPKDGWYTEILAPYLGESGRLIAAIEPANTPERTRLRSRYLDKVADAPDIFGEAAIVTFDPPNSDLRPVGGVDAVISAFNVAAWIRNGVVDGAFAAAYRALKSGGVLGIVEYRAAPGSSVEETKRTGRIEENYIIERAKASGFVLKARSDIGAKPQDARAPERATLLFAKPIDAPVPVDVVRSARNDR